MQVAGQGGHDGAVPAQGGAAAGIPADSPLVARVEEPGRIVLESPQLLLTRLQDDVAAALLTHAASTPVRNLVEELFADRAADASLESNVADPTGRCP